MATFRCESCKGIYLDPQQGMRYFHTCPTEIRNAVGDLVPTPNPRDENIVHVLLVGKGVPEGRPLHEGETIGHLRSAGAGRVKLSDQDLLSTANAARLAQLRQLPGVQMPDPPIVYDPRMSPSR